jgi:hypothetical protein
MSGIWFVVCHRFHRRPLVPDLLQPTNRRRTLPVDDDPIPLLEPGDHLDQATFHARYAAMPEDVKAELIGGVVYMPAALRRAHGRSSGLLVRWLGAYEDETPGVELYDNTTTIMGDNSEPQPDACLIVQPEFGGQMRVTEDDYLQGAPELVGEVASSTEALIQLNGRRLLEVLRQGLATPGHAAFVAQLAARSVAKDSNREP